MIDSLLRRKKQRRNASFDHAIVIGGSIAGLTAARVLAGHFTKVTIIERDRLPTAPEFRRGVPQARHVHVLRLLGQQILEQQFPGLIDELLAKGATMVNAGNEAEFFLFDQWRRPHYQSAINSVTFSRPLLETSIVRRLAAHPKIAIIQGYNVASLNVDEHGNHVTGVRLRRRGIGQVEETQLRADLVVDASGRESKAPEWLESLGYPVPPETVIDAFPGYTTRIYRRPAASQIHWKTMYIIPTPPDHPRGGVIVPIEHDRWLVTLVGMGQDYPPTDEEGFLAFARSLPSPKLYEAIKTAQPLTKPYSFRRTGSRLRHFQQLSRYLEGFLALGDAVCTLNPIHAQGMTVAAMSSLTLDQCLQTAGDDLDGFAQKFQQKLSQVVAGPWQLGVSSDRRWPTTEGVETDLKLIPRLRQQYFSYVLQVMVHNPKIAEAFFHVQHMVESPTVLFEPAIVLQVLSSILHHKRSKLYARLAHAIRSFRNPLSVKPSS